MCCVLEYTIVAIFSKVLKKISVFDKFKKWFFWNNFLKLSSVTYFIAYYFSLLKTALETYYCSPIGQCPDNEKTCWTSAMKIVSLFFEFFWQFPVATDKQYLYQTKAFLRAYNFCVYFIIDISHHVTVFSLSLQNQGYPFIHTRISLEPHNFLSRVLFHC